jgi:DNA polymerase-3 subunit epsilon
MERFESFFCGEFSINRVYWQSYKPLALVSRVCQYLHMGIFDRVKKIAEAVQDVRASNDEYTYGRFVVLDVETTGLNPDIHRILEISLVSVVNGEVVEAWSTYLNPEAPIGKTEIHGITESDVKNAPRFADALPEIQKRIEGIAIIAHNAKFDLAFLRSEFERSGYRSPWLPSICTLSASNYYQPHLSRRRLADCCEDIGVRVENAHSATGDAIATAQLFHYYLDPKKDPAPRELDLAILRDPGNAKPGVSDSGRRNPHVQRRIQEQNAARAKTLSSNSHNNLVKLLSNCSFAEVLNGESFPGESEYLEKLIEFLGDGAISEDESEELRALADVFELTPGQIELAHKNLVKALTIQALKDESISVVEREELNSVSDVLKIQKSVIADLIKEAKDLRAEALSVNLKELPKDWNLGEPLRVGQKVVFTGCEPALRTRLENQSKKLGVAISSKVSAKTSFLITDGSYVGNKANDAAQFGTRVVTPEEYKLLLKYIQPALIGSDDVEGKKSSQTGAEGLDPSVVRAWAISHGIEVSPKGRIHSDVYELYRKSIATDK